MLEKAGADAARLQTHRAAVPESGAAEADEGRHHGRISQHLRRLAHIAPRPAPRVYFSKFCLFACLQHHRHLEGRNLGADAHQRVGARRLDLGQYPAQKCGPEQLADRDLGMARRKLKPRYTKTSHTDTKRPRYTMHHHAKSYTQLCCGPAAPKAISGTQQNILKS